MSPTDYDTVVNVEAYSYVETPRMLPPTQEHDGLLLSLFFGLFCSFFFLSASSLKFFG